MVKGTSGLVFKTWSGPGALPFLIFFSAFIISVFVIGPVSTSRSSPGGRSGASGMHSPFRTPAKWYFHLSVVA